MLYAGRQLKEESHQCARHELLVCAGNPVGAGFVPAPAWVPVGAQSGLTAAGGPGGRPLEAALGADEVAYKNSKLKCMLAMKT